MLIHIFGTGATNAAEVSQTVLLHPRKH